MPTIIDGTGPVLTHARIVLIFWGADWDNHPAIPSTEVEKVFRAILVTPYMSRLSQYRSIKNAEVVVSLTDASHVFPNRNITGVIAPAFTDAELRSMLCSHFDDGSLPSPNSQPDLLYMVVTSLAVVPSDDNNGDAGYHNSFSFGAAQVHYAWISNPGTFTSSNPISKTFVHELVEAVSDPELNAFTLPPPPGASKNMEIADQCNTIFQVLSNVISAHAPNGVMVQPYWSDRDQTCVLPTKYSVLWTFGSQVDLSKGLRQVLPGAGVGSLLAAFRE